MKKICILTSVHPAFDVRIFHKEAKTLAKAGYNVTLIAQHDKGEVIDNIEIISLRRPKNRIYRMCGLTLKVFTIALETKADLYHFHDPELLPIVIFSKLLTGKKIIYDVHEDLPKGIISKYWIPRWIRKFVSFFVDFVEKRLSYFVDSIICATEEIQKNFRSKNVICISNFPILQYFEHNKSEESTHRNGNFRFIYAGGLAAERGISQIVQAMKHLNSDKDVKLILCGEFSPASYEKEVRSLNGFKRVEYLGWIKPEEAYSKMVQADVGIVCFLPEPNHVNAAPNKLFEYMAAGLPVIASNFPLWKEIVEGNKCGICVNPLDPKEIAKAIEYLIEHKEEAKRMGENGRRAILEKYNWENESKKLLNIYEYLFKK